MRNLNRIICSLLLVFIFQGYSSQITRLSIKIDQIKSRIEKAESDSIKIVLYNEWNNISYIYEEEHQQELKINQTIVKLCNKNILNESNKLKKHWYKEKLWNSLNNIGHYYNDRGDLNNAVNYFTQCSKILKEVNNLEGFLKILYGQVMYGLVLSCIVIFALE